MNERDLKKLHLLLTERIADLLNETSETSSMPLPYIGKETAYYMAAAALAVLEAAEDLKESLSEDGELKES